MPDPHGGGPATMEIVIGLDQQISRSADQKLRALVLLPGLRT
jgi:hypothetical protein